MKSILSLLLILLYSTIIISLKLDDASSPVAKPPRPEGLSPREKEEALLKSSTSLKAQNYALPASETLKVIIPPKPKYKPPPRPDSPPGSIVNSNVNSLPLSIRNDGASTHVQNLLKEYVKDVEMRREHEKTNPASFDDSSEFGDDSSEFGDVNANELYSGLSKIEQARFSAAHGDYVPLDQKKAWGFKRLFSGGRSKDNNINHALAKQAKDDYDYDGDLYDDLLNADKGVYSPVEQKSAWGLNRYFRGRRSKVNEEIRSVAVKKLKDINESEASKGNYKSMPAIPNGWSQKEKKVNDKLNYDNYRKSIEAKAKAGVYQVMPQKKTFGFTRFLNGDLSKDNLRNKNLADEWLKRNSK